MQVTVSLTVERDATTGLDDLERQALEAGRRAMGELVRAAVAAYEAAQGRCPGCGGTALGSRGTRRRVLRTRFGRVELRLQRREGAGCGRRFRPADGCLQEVAGHGVTAGLARACALAGASWPSAEAAAVLAELSGAPVSAETGRALTGRAGRAAARRQAAEAEAAGRLSGEQARAERAAEAAGAGPAGDGWLLVGLDGGWVASRDQAGGMEGKVGVVAAGYEAVGRHGRHRLRPRRSVATFADAARVGALADAAARRLGVEEAATQWALGDGAEGIKRQVDWHFPRARGGLDWAHAARAVHRAIRAARPGPALKAERAALHAAIPAALWPGDADAALEQLRALRPPAEAEACAGLEKAIAYLEGQRAWLGPYATWQEAGEPVGSGLVERAVEVVFNRRLKRRGMRWRRANADAVAALRVDRLNGDWERRYPDLPLAA